MLKRIRPLAVFVLGLFTCACQSNRQPPPFEIHSAGTGASTFAGTTLSGPVQTNAAAISFDGALEVHARWFALESLNDQNMPLLASEATLVTDRLADQAVVPSTSLTSNARIGWFVGDNAAVALNAANPGRSFELGESRAALARGTTVSFRAFDTQQAGDETLSKPEPRFVEINLSLASRQPAVGQNFQIALGIQDTPPAKRGDDGSKWPAGVYQFETALLDHPVKVLPTSFLVIVPFKLSGPPNQAVAAFVTLSAGKNDADFEAVVARAKADLAGGPAAAANPSWTLGLDRALKELDDPAHRRAALVYLAGQGDAEVCQDTAMLAGDEMLRQVAASVKQNAPAAIQQGSLPAFSWILERSAISAMQPLLAKAMLPPELFTVLSEHFGEPGRHSASVDEIMHGSTSVADLQQKLVSENYIYLEDASPASRVRAYDWLEAHKLAPAGFDPLASPKQRRLALDKALSSTATNGGGQ